MMEIQFIVAEGGFGSEGISSYLYGNCKILQVAEGQSGRFVAFIMVANHAGFTANALAQRLMSGTYGARVFDEQTEALAEYSEAALRELERDITRQLTLTLTIKEQA